MNETGIEQARQVGEHLKCETIRAIYSSPLKRAYDTASKIAKFHDMPVNAHDDLIDLDFGDWQGRLHKELEEEYPELYHHWLTSPHTMRFPHGETLSSMRRRVERSLKELGSRYGQDTIVIVTHGVVLRVILCILHNVENDKYFEFDMDNCAITIAEFNAGKYSIIVENDTRHIRNDV